MKPEDVLSPRSRTRNHQILFKSDTDDNGEGWSICQAEVRETNDEDDQEWNVRIGYRWDGVRDDPQSKGFPNTSGQGVWTWLPYEVADFFLGARGIIATLSEQQRREKHEARVRRSLKSIETMMKAVQPTPAPSDA